MIFEGGAKHAGMYRRQPASVLGSVIPPVPPHRVGTLMKQLHMKLLDLQKDFDGAGKPDQGSVLHAAVEFYHRLCVIHPFTDSNGRTARLGMNHLLRRYDLPYCIYPSLDQGSGMLKALNEADKGNFEPLILLAKACLHQI